MPSTKLCNELEIARRSNIHGYFFSCSSMKKFSHTRGYIGLLVAHLSLFPWHETTKELALWVVGRDWSLSVPHRMLRFVLFCSFAVQLS